MTKPKPMNKKQAEREFLYAWIKRKYEEHRQIADELVREMDLFGRRLLLLRRLSGKEADDQWEAYLGEQIQDLSIEWARDCIVHALNISKTTSIDSPIKEDSFNPTVGTKEHQMEALIEGIRIRCNEVSEISARVALIRCVRRAYTIGRDLVKLQRLEEKNANRDTPNPIVDIPGEAATKLIGLYQRRQVGVPFYVDGIRLPLHLSYSDPPQVYVTRFGRVERQQT